MAQPPTFPIPAVMAVVVHAGAVLLVQRGNPPNAGRWGFPGGKMECGETWRQAAERELFEETGILAAAQRLLSVTDGIHHNARGELQHHYLLLAVQCQWQGGTAQALSDAQAVHWLPLNALEHTELDLIEGVARILQEATAGP
jgi:ADP-ribose pyrophosphatase YjhB (NUDIX family)